MSEILCTCGKPTSGAWLCVDCQKTLAIALVNIAAYYDDLATIATKRTRYGSTGGGKVIGKTQPLPVDLRFLDVIGDGTQVRWDVWASVVAWCKAVMEEQPELVGPMCHIACLHTSCAAARRRRWPRNTLRSMVAYLDRQFRWIVREQWAPQMLDEMLDNERRLRRMVDRPADRWYAGKCSVEDEGGECGAELYASTDSGYVYCPGCGIQHDIAERRDYLLKEAKGYLVTATEAAGALLAWTDYDGSETKLVDRIRKWRDRDRVETHGSVVVSGKPRDLYRLGDLQALLVDDAQREQTRRMRAS